ncbi:MAG: alginate export family protein [FCB group bacterium]|nr:alginate export family protein [FCB group bacterium]
MKKILLGSMLCSSLLVGLVFAQGNLKISGQIRHRYEMSDKDFDGNTGADNFSYLRTRLNIGFSPVEGTQAFVQIQDSRKFGEEFNTLKDASADNMDFHQAYFSITKLFGLPLDVKVGRFEVNYGPQRFIGAVGWSNFGRSFDGAILNFTNNLLDIDFFNFKTVESALVGDKGDKIVRGIYSSLNLLKGQTSQVFLIQDDKMNTVGTYVKGGVAGLSYVFEFALQNGKINNSTNVAAMMYGLNAGYKLSGFALSLGLDYISGDDTTTTEYESFNTMYSTNHKYYGYMDYFLNLPVHTNNLGLKDLYVTAELDPIMGVKPIATYHIFRSDQKDANGNSDFGNELDITLKHRYNEKVTFVAGYSIFMPGALKATDGDRASWAYLMTIVNF